VIDFDTVRHASRVKLFISANECETPDVGPDF